MWSDLRDLAAESIRSALGHPVNKLVVGFAVPCLPLDLSWINPGPDPGDAANIVASAGLVFAKQLGHLPSSLQDALLKAAKEAVTDLKKAEALADNMKALADSAKAIDNADDATRKAIASALESHQDISTLVKKTPTTPPLRPETIYLGNKKHGINWKQGPATAKSLRTPQGQWTQKDFDFAAEKAATLKPGEGQWFPLPEGSTSVVHMPDGTTVKAIHIWVRNNGSGTFHGYPGLGE